MLADTSMLVVSIRSHHTNPTPDTQTRIREATFEKTAGTAIDASKSEKFQVQVQGQHGGKVESLSKCWKLQKYKQQHRLTAGML